MPTFVNSVLKRGQCTKKFTVVRVGWIVYSELMIVVACTQCGIEFEAETGRYNRAIKIGSPLFCGMKCAGLHRRKTRKTEEKRRADKSEYDRLRRERLADRIKKEKADYFQRTYDPIKAALERKARMPKHVEYCRREEYRTWKREYDKSYRSKEYGEFAEAYQLLIELEKEINSRMTRFEVYATNERRHAQWRKRQLNLQR